MTHQVKVEISNNQKAVRMESGTNALVRLACSAVLKAEEFDRNALVSVCFVDNEQIQELNKTYRNKDAVTDVLSFPTFDGGDYDTDPESGYSILGDIVINAERAMLQAEEYGHSQSRELAFLTVHSCLHLLGYDHETSEKEEREMREKEENILKSLGETR